jgi:hypothetical protein
VVHNHPSPKNLKYRLNAAQISYNKEQSRLEKERTRGQQLIDEDIINPEMAVLQKSLKLLEQQVKNLKRSPQAPKGPASSSKVTGGGGVNGAKKSHQKTLKKKSSQPSQPKKKPSRSVAPTHPWTRQDNKARHKAKKAPKKGGPQDEI